MKYAELPDFPSSVARLWKHGGRHQKAADAIHALKGRFETLEDPLHGLRRTKHGESRIRNCVKYDLNDYCRLVTVQTNGYCILLTCGSHEDVDRWLERHRGFIPVVGADGRATATYCSSESEHEQQVSGTAGHFIGPLRNRLPEELFDILVEGLPRRIARPLEDVDATVAESELKALVAAISDEGQRLVLYDVFALLRQDRVKEAIARVKLYMGEITPLESIALPDIVDSDVIRRIDPASPQYQEALTRFMKTARYRDWMLFMHPDQDRIATEDFDGPAKLVGVSGSGKTCVVVQRAVRLAAKYPGQRILVLTLNRALAALIADLITACAPPEDAARIEVKAFFVLCQELLGSFEPAARRLYDEITWKTGEHVDEVWQEYYRCENNNDDAQVFEEVHDSLLAQGWDAERYLRQEVDWLRSALRPEERARYPDLLRKGRTVPLNARYKQRILEGTAGWEDKMSVVGVIDALGIAQRLATHHSRLRPMYRCILVDEVQDFGNVELEIVRALVSPGENDVFLCGDAAQAVSFKHQSMREAGILVTKGRSRQLSLNYRNSRDVLAAAFEVLWQNLGDEMFDREDLDILDPEYSAFTGATPLLLQASSLAEELRSAIATCRERVTGGEERKACIAICGFTLYEITKFGEAVGLPVLDGSIAINDGEVFLSDLEQTKGFEFDLVCVLNAAEGVLPQPAAPTEERFRDLSRLYVAMTRAKSELIVSYSGAPSPFLLPAGAVFYASSWKEYADFENAPSVGVPTHIEQFREAGPQRAWADMAAREFLRTSQAIGVSTELSAKMRQLIDGIGLRRQRDELKWRNLGAAIGAFRKQGRVRALWGPEVGRQFSALVSRLEAEAAPREASLDLQVSGTRTRGGVDELSPQGAATIPLSAIAKASHDTPADHAALLRQRFTPKCSRGAFSVEDWKQLQRYGVWYQALCEGAIEPFTAEQKAFVRLFRGEEERAAKSSHERVWAAYLARVARERNLGDWRVPLTLRGSSRTGSDYPNGDDRTVYFQRR